MKDLGVNLTEHVLDLWAENYTTLIKEIKEGLTKREDILCPQIGRLVSANVSASQIDKQV